jgi:hypothetical protein
MSCITIHNYSISTVHFLHKGTKVMEEHVENVTYPDVQYFQVCDSVIFLHRVFADID